MRARAQAAMAATVAAMAATVAATVATVGAAAAAIGAAGTGEAQAGRALARVPEQMRGKCQKGDETGFKEQMGGGRRGERY